MLLITPAWGHGAAPAAAVIRILDYAVVPTDALQQAIDLSQGILRESGIETQWLLCKPQIDPHDPCDPSIGSSDISVTILTQSADEKTRRSGALGCVSRIRKTAVAIYVFHGRVKSVAAFAPYDPSIVLGMVLTHEIGHFLGLEDSLSGIMLPSFRRDQMMQAASGALTFDKGQADCLRAALRTRRHSPR